jgi:hypothetical protein
MKKSLFSLVLLLTSIWVFSQSNNLNRKIMDPKAEQEILIGYCTRDGLMSSAFATYLTDEHDKYKPDMKIVQEILPKIEDITITVIMGTWCDDSRQQVPRFFKILDALEVTGPPVTIICVDKDKKGGPVSLDGMNLDKVPTFIFYRDKKELGRIIETPAVTLEQDILAILSKQ